MGLYQQVQAKTKTFQSSAWKKTFYKVKALSAGFLDLVIHHLHQPKQKGKKHPILVLTTASMGITEVSEQMRHRRFNLRGVGILSFCHLQRRHFHLHRIHLFKLLVQNLDRRFQVFHAPQLEQVEHMPPCGGKE